jgi:DNA-binding transcriptional ArsR family regulator
LLRGEILALLEKSAGQDIDWHARRVAMSSLLNHPLILMEPSDDLTYWSMSTERKLTRGSDYDNYPMQISSEEQKRVLNLLGERALGDPYTFNRYALLNALAETKDPQSVPFLSRAAISEPDDNSRYWAVAGLANASQSDESYKTLRQVLESDPSDRIKEAALHSLAKAGLVDDYVVSRLLQLAADTPGNLETVARAYAASKAPALGARLLEQLGSADEEVRIEAIRGIGITKDPGFIPHLEEKLRTETDSVIQSKLTRSIAQLKGANPK